MNEIISTSVRPHNSALTATGDRRPPSALIALPELPITVRLGTIDDLPFVDELQKKNNKSLGFMNRPTLEGKIKREEVLIAEEVASCELRVASEDTGKPDFGTGGVPTVAPSASVLPTHNSQLGTTPVGYLIGNDRYFKRDELGAIFQLCVVPGRRRGLVGATLLKSLFDRASYGCKLYCCWCAQDLEANHFWEAMGFVAVGFRTGAKKKIKGPDGKKTDRVHIFWQKRIRAGDVSTPWWYPHETGGGAIGEDRIVLPIPPNVHWSQVRSVVVPGEEVGGRESTVGGEDLHLLPTADQRPATESKTKRPKPSATIQAPQSRSVARLVAPQFGSKMKAVKEKVAREKPAPTVKKKNDPAKVKAARYLRDRYCEEINSNPYLVPNGKYDVSRLIENVALPDGAVPVDQKLLAA